jgi:predicted alpha/beta hydrolase family esterase
MRTADVDIILVPGWGKNSDDHWMSRWGRNIKTARTVQQADWNRPERIAWAGSIVAEVEKSQRPAVLVGHSCGGLAIVHAAPALPPGIVAGAILVAPPDLEVRPAIDDLIRRDGDPLVYPEGFLPVPEDRLPFASVVVASTSDPFCTIDRARRFAAAWGSEFSDAGDAGHVNTASGHGPWPEGLLRLGTFLKGLG